MPTVNLISTTEAAESLGISADRVRQLCAAHSVGTLLTSRTRVLDSGDVKKLRKILDSQTHRGYPRGVPRKKS